MFRRLRIAVLLLILLSVALGEFLAKLRSHDWDGPLWVDIYLVNGSGTEATDAYIASLPPDAFATIERFFAAQAKDYGLSVDRPFEIRNAGRLEALPPPVPETGGFLATVIWSLEMRWFVTRLHFASDEPTPDITFFAIYHEDDGGAALDRSTALEKGMIGIAHLFARHSARGSNEVVIAHELFHTLGATDKYDLATTLPIYPAGFADPGQSPLYPQRRAELMAGRIPLRKDKAEIPASLADVMLGPQTAYEIGWIDEPANSR